MVLSLTVVAIKLYRRTSLAPSSQSDLTYKFYDLVS